MSVIERAKQAAAADVRTMQAAVVHNFAGPLAIDEKPVPEARDGEIIVRIETCGLAASAIRRMAASSMNISPAGGSVCSSRSPLELRVQIPANVRPRRRTSASPHDCRQ